MRLVIRIQMPGNVTNLRRLAPPTRFAAFSWTSPSKKFVRMPRCRPYCTAQVAQVRELSATRHVAGGHRNFPLLFLFNALTVPSGRWLHSCPATPSPERAGLSRWFLVHLPVSPELPVASIEWKQLENSQLFDRNSIRAPTVKRVLR